jgi:hypothetical protein
MICKEYVFDKIKIPIYFTGQYFINKENKYSHTSPLYSIKKFEDYIYIE